ncbi:MAG: CvpA family protein [Phycisphaerales bacterium]|nr:CvpA family protein [Phycisphaerales bacterium]
MMNILVIVVVLAMAYTGVLKKFFSSLLHMACVIVAGAIAFAFWEPLSYLILNKAPTRGFFDFIEYSAWAIGLVVPFGASLAVLRVATDKLAPANAIAVPAADVVGAGVCGAISGLITAGILVIAIGTMRFKNTDFGYQPIKVEGGSLVRSGKLLIPADQIVGKLYAMTSEAAFASANPLARWRPEPWHAAEVMRMTDSGLGRNTARPADYGVLARYRVDAADGENLYQDRWANTPQAVKFLDGESVGPNAYIEGVVLDIKPSLREPSSSFVAISAGQVWMIAEDAATGKRLDLHPIAAVANPQGAETSLARFLYESPNFSLASAGAAVRPMAFEFAVPKSYQPIAIYLKNIRQVLRPVPDEVTYTVAERDRAIEDGSLIEGSTPIPKDYGKTPQGGSQAQGPNTGRPQSPEDEARDKGLSPTNTLGRLTIQKGTEKGLRIGEGNHILEGDEKWDPKALGVRAIDRKLMIDKFQVDDGVVMVQVDVSGERPGSLLGQAMAAAERIVPPQLIDTNGIAYDAVGWIYQDRDKVYIRYTPGQPIRGLSELADKDVVLSSSRSDQKLTLLFLCSFNSQIKSFNIGNKVVFEMGNPLKLDKKQK